MFYPMLTQLKLNGKGLTKVLYGYLLECKQDVSNGVDALRDFYQFNDNGLQNIPVTRPTVLSNDYLPNKRDGFLSEHYYKSLVETFSRE